METGAEEKKGKKRKARHEVAATQENGQVPKLREKSWEIPQRGLRLPHEVSWTR